MNLSEYNDKYGFDNLSLNLDLQYEGRKIIWDDGQFKAMKKFKIATHLFYTTLIYVFYPENNKEIIALYPYEITVVNETI